MLPRWAWQGGRCAEVRWLAASHGTCTAAGTLVSLVVFCTFVAWILMDNGCAVAACSVVGNLVVLPDKHHTFHPMTNAAVWESSSQCPGILEDNLMTLCNP